MLDSLKRLVVVLCPSSSAMRTAWAKLKVSQTLRLAPLDFRPPPYEFMGFGAMDVTKPYKFIGFGDMDVTKACKSIGFI